MIFQINAMRSEVIAQAADEPILSSASLAAFNPKYGSITTAFSWNRSFKPTRIGRNVEISPLAPTMRIR